MVSTLLFRLILLFLPGQLGYHFWPEYARVLGLKIDYLSPTLYFTHVLIFLFLGLNLKKTIDIAKKQKVFFGTIILLSIANSLFSYNPGVTVYRWLEFLLLCLLFFYVQSNKKLLRKNLSFLYLSISVVVLLQLYQFVNQKSFNGIFYWLGERFFSQSTPAIPKYQLFDRALTRVPSTFSHANSLAGFMLLSLVSLNLLKASKLLKITAILSIIISGSKNAILFLPLYFIKKTSLKNILLICFAITIVLVIVSPTGNNYNYTVSSRLSGIQESIQIFKTNPLLGVGFGSYINGLAVNVSGSETTYEKLQPVHNIYLLLLSEIGLIGLLVLFVIIRHSRIGQKQSLIIGVVLLTGLFDHYWLTLIQNKALLTILLASFPVEYET